MKNAIRFITLSSMIAAALFWLVGCGDASHQHVAEAKENLKEAGQEMNEAAKAANEEAKTKATADWQQFKHTADSTLAAMEMQMDKLDQRILQADKKERARLTREMDNAKAKLRELKEKLQQQSIDFEADAKLFDQAVAAKNEAFKSEFIHDMNELGSAIKGLFTDDVK
jgi:hypothetical protein